MNKKRVLIALDTLNVGGEEVSAIALLKALPIETMDVTLLMLHPTGALMGSVPKHVNVVSPAFSTEGQMEHMKGLKSAFVDALHKASIPYLVSLGKRLILSIREKSGLRRYYMYWSSLEDADFLKDAYDVAMCYCSCVQLQYLLARRVNARKKVVWFHCELKKQGVSLKYMEPVFAEYDIWVAAASDKIVEEYGSVFPEYRDRLRKKPLLIDMDACSRKSILEDGFVRGDGEVILFSIGRLSYQKGFDIAIEVAEKLRDEGISFRWYVAGSGPLADELDRMIVSKGLGSHFILMGQKINPYPWLRTCDIYVQPSRFEGYCITLAEARMFNKPIVCTDFAGAQEQVVNRRTALVCKPNVNDLLVAIKALILDRGLCYDLRKNLSEQNGNVGKDATELIKLFN